MLVLKKVLGNTLGRIHVHVYDTNSGKTYDTTNTELKDKEVFGVVELDRKTIFGTDYKVLIEIDDITWHLFDMIDSPIHCGKYEKAIAFREYLIDRNSIYLFYPFELKPLDKDLIFWQCKDHTTIFAFYDFAFRKPIKYTPDMNVYIVSIVSKDTYKLDMNSRVIKFMEKVVILRRD